MPTRILTAADITAAIALDNGALDEMRADFPRALVRAYTLAEWQSFRASGNHKVIAYVRSGVVRGFLLVLRTPAATVKGHVFDGWQIVRVVTDKGLTAAQRLGGFDEVRRAVAPLVNPAHIIWGLVKATGQFNDHLVSLGYTREAADREVDTVTERPDVLIDGVMQAQEPIITYRNTVALFYATAAVVAV